MAGTIIHNKGISRLASQMKVEKGKWYNGFICTNCGARIYSLEDPSKGAIQIVGEGRFSVPCAACRTDEIIYKTSDIQTFQAENDGPPGTALPRKKPSNRPRQPLSRRYPKAKPTFGTRFLEDRSECAIIIARCISIWSYIEVELALLLAVILKINTEPAVAMFLAMRNSRTQTEVLTAAAETALNTRDFELFGAIMNVKSTYESERNDLVHGAYGGSLLVENGILWQEQKYNVGYTAQVWAADYKDMDPENMRKTTFVYEAEDLETIAQKFEWLHQMLGSFRGYVWSPDAEWRAGRYPQLCAEPRIAQELSRMRANQKKR